MDKTLNRVYRINDHPIASLDAKFRAKYVTGLAACLFSLSDSSKVVNLFFSVWAQSILKGPISNEQIWRDDIDSIKEAISIQRKGFRFFSMRYDFFFDVFYLLQAAYSEKTSPEIIERSFNYLQKNVCGRRSKRALEDIYLLFTKNLECNRVSPILLQHRSDNESFLSQKEKKVLVVANVSAGKSTLINSLIGYRTNKSKTTACTNHVCSIFNKPVNDGVTISRSDGSYCYFNSVEDVNSDDFVNAAMHFNSPLSMYPICFVDTPGINFIDDKSHRKITEDAIIANNYDAVIYVSNCQYFGTNDEYDILMSLKKHTNKPIIFVLNQLDRFKRKEDSISKMVNDYRSDLIKIGFKTPTVVPLSARAALFFKLPEIDLDDEDKEDKANYNSQFKVEYYNLPSYVGVCNKEQTPIDETGIQYLEKSIINLLFP